MKPAWICSSVLVAFLASCAATPSAEAAVDGGAQPEQKKEDDLEDELRELAHELEIKKARLEIARLEEEAFAAAHETKLRHAKADVELAEARLAAFRDAESPRRLASERLDLQHARDRAQEAADELAQIQIMYEGQDLDDLTAEFVVSRGRRSAARAAARIELQERALNALEERELPQELRKLELALDRATTGLSELEREGEIAWRGKVIAVQEAEHAVQKVARELEAKQEDGA